MSFQYRPPSRLMSLLRGDIFFWLCVGAVVTGVTVYVLIGGV